MRARKYEIRAERTIFSGGIDIYVGQVDQNGFLCQVAEPVVLKPVDDEVNYDPTISLRPDAAQKLMDELWQCGIRPTEGSGSAGSLAATERHLGDMKKIAFGLLKKDGIEV